jgi:DNA helicase-2/ATP-dependent DNA helicase PcrA
MSRLSALTPVNTRGMWVGTFHGLCNRMLRAHYRDAGLPQAFQIMDMQDQLALIKRVYKAHNIDDERFPARQLQSLINASKEEGLRPNQVEAHDDFTRRQVEHFALYEQACQRDGVVDFPELLLRTYELLTRHEGLREHYRRRFSHILVDEFQDTNVLQYKWLKLLTSPQTSVFAVGDDDQSIYAFRGANVANMQHFERDFGVAGAPVQLIKLEQNYRSHGRILDAANALIKHNQGRLGKNLWTADAEGEPVRALPRRPTSTRRHLSSTWSTAWSPTACRRRRSPCSTVPTRSRAWSSTRCSTPACRIGSTAACAFSSARK